VCRSETGTGTGHADPDPHPVPERERDDPPRVDGPAASLHVVDRAFGLHERDSGTDPDDRPDPERARRVLTCPPRH
jgi:hypothetical protein